MPHYCAASVITFMPRMKNFDGAKVGIYSYPCKEWRKYLVFINYFSFSSDN